MSRTAVKRSQDLAISEGATASSTQDLTTSSAVVVGGIGSNSATLKQRSLVAVAWSAADAGGRLLVQFIVSLVLARLVSPAEFGLIGMLSFFLGTAQVLVDSGFSSALIQRKNLTQDDSFSVFVFSIFAGTILTALLCLSAPWIALFYNEPILTGLCRLLSLNVLLGSLGTVQSAILARELDFKTPWKIGIAAAICSGPVAIWLAWRGLGVWSLAIQSVVSSLITTTMLWMYHPWRPAGQFDTTRLGSLFNFGSRLVITGFINLVFDRAHFLVIGKAYSPDSLGFYARAQTTQQLPASIISQVVTRVTLPVFSSITDDLDRLRNGVQKMMKSIMMLTIPMMIGVAMVARPLVLALFGSRWLPCVPYLQILALAGVFWPLHVINLNVLVAMGRSDLVLRAEILKKSLIAIGLAVTVPVSVMAMVWGTLLVGVACYLVNAYYSASLLGYGSLRQLRDLIPYATGASCMALALWPLQSVLNISPLWDLFLLVGIGAVIYFAFLGLTFPILLRETASVILQRKTGLPFIHAD